MNSLQTASTLLSKQQTNHLEQNTRFQEKLERLKREKTSHSTEELDRLGWTRYAEIQGELEVQHHGDYVMIEVDSGDYFVEKSPQKALRQVEVAYPGKAFCLIRIGYKATQAEKGLIEGRVNEFLEPVVEIGLKWGESVTMIPAIVGTGFSGYLC